MTLVVSIASKFGLWQASDHRLTFRDGRIVDSSIKHLQLEADDAKAMISYAGVGKVQDTQISDWLRRLLRGRRRTVEQHLGLVAERATAILGKHCRAIGTGHTFSITAFVRDEPRFYWITNRLQRDSKIVIGEEFQFHGRRLAERCTTIVNAEGSGALALPRNDIWTLTQGTIQRRKRKETLGTDVMASLARLNRMTSNKLSKERSPSVSPTCLVSHLRSSKDGFIHKYFGDRNAVVETIIPTIAGIHDVKQIAETLIPFTQPALQKMLEQMKSGQPVNENLDIEKLNQQLAMQDWNPTDAFD